ncbi:Tyrosinase [Dactylella cylindrospora]|nr:Tyrosinase [Dactylella cylindrospora]
MLHEIMLQIVELYPETDGVRDRYKAAADTFRIPYWDSAELKDRNGRRSLNVPYLCTLPVVEVYTPTGMTQIDNPLYRFKFNPGPTGLTSFQDQTGEFFPFSTALGTSRYPPRYNSRNPTVTEQWSEGAVNNDEVTEAMRNLSSFGEDVYRTFTSSNYVWYSSTQQSNPPAPNSYQSLEGVHNEIHGIVGGGGHMSWPTVSSFDPIFWLHHANVDRLFAIWQAIYPNSWFDDPRSQLPDERGTWSIGAGTRETPRTPLAPFHKDTRGGTYTSDEIRDWTRFGYSYPELQPWLPQYQSGGQFNRTLYRNDLVQQVTNLYGRVNRRVERTSVPRTRLFAASQSGVPSFAGSAAGASAASTSQPKVENLPPPPLAQNPAPTTQSAPQPQPPVVQAQPAPPAPKPSGLRGLMSSAQKHFDEAVSAGRDAAHGAPAKPQTASTSSSSASGTSNLATKFGGIIGGGFHMAQERLGPKKPPSGSGTQSRGFDGEDSGPEPLSRGMESMALSEPITYHEYDVNVRFERFDLGGRPFTVHIFLGDFNPDPSTWTFDKNRVGGVHNFVAGVQRGDGACSNCEQQSEDHTIVTGQISLTNALLDDVEDPSNGLNSLLPEEVTPYLQRHLHWRVTDLNGVDIPREQIRSLKVSVVECSATLPSNPGEFTQYGEPRVIDIVTEGRPGGKAADDGY